MSKKDSADKDKPVVETNQKAEKPSSETKKPSNTWVVLIYMAATSPDLRKIMERDLAEMSNRLRLISRKCLRVYALMDTADGQYAIRHALHRVMERDQYGAVSEQEHPIEAVPLNKDLANTLGGKGAFLADFVKWRFRSNPPGGAPAPAPALCEPAPDLAPQGKDLGDFNKTMLILWGHSQGVAAALSRPGSPAYSMVGNGGFGFNRLSGDALSLPEIRRAIARGQRATYYDEKEPKLRTDHEQKLREKQDEADKEIASATLASRSAVEAKHEAAIKQLETEQEAELEQTAREEASKKIIHILSFDSCFMSAAEVGAEFQRCAPKPPRDDFHVFFEDQRGGRQVSPEDQALQKIRKRARANENKAAFVDHVIASQTAVLLDGLDYGRIVDAFIAAKCPGDVGPTELGRRLLEQACSGDRSPVSLTLINTQWSTGYSDFSSKFEELVKRLGQILDTATTRPSRRAFADRVRQAQLCTASGHFLANDGASRSEWLRIRDAFEGATWHQVRQFIDVADLCRRLANNSRDADLRRKALGVLQTLQPDSSEKEASNDTPLIVDVRSAHPLVFSGLSIYCPWLFPTPEEVNKGAWNAIVDLFDYATNLWFNRKEGEGSWGGFVFHAKHVLEESRQRAINSEIADLRSGAACCKHAPSEAGPRVVSPPLIPGEYLDKPGGGGFEIAEPVETQQRYAGSFQNAAARMRLEAENAASLRPDSVTKFSINPPPHRD